MKQLTDAEKASFGWLERLCEEPMYADRLGPICDYLKSSLDTARQEPVNAILVDALKALLSRVDAYAETSVAEFPDIEANAEAALTAAEQTQPEPAVRYQFICSNGCGECGVRIFEFEYSRTESLSGELIEGKTYPQIVSTCCNSEVDIWDTMQDNVTGYTVSSKQPEGAPLSDEQITVIGNIHSNSDVAMTWGEEKQKSYMQYTMPIGLLLQGSKIYVKDRP